MEEQTPPAPQPVESTPATSPVTSQLVICAFEGAEKADAVRDAIIELDRQTDAIKLGNIAVVRRNDAGEIVFDESKDWRNFASNTAGAVTNGVTWLLYNIAGMMGPVSGPLAGQKMQNAVNRFASDSGFPDAALRELGERLIAGQSALISVVKPAEQPLVVQELERLGGHIVSHEVAGDLIDKLSAPDD
jgi:uncharacterized membrane protein